MPLPQPKPNERYKKFVVRFLSDEKVKKEYPAINQRFAIMASTWRKSKK